MNSSQERGKILFCVKKGGRKIVNVLLESDRRCPPTSANDYPVSRRERDDEAARAVPPRTESPARCPPTRGHDNSNTRTTEEEEEEEKEAPAANTTDQTRDSADGPQGRRPNPRTTPQLLATKVPSSCTHAYAQVYCFVCAFHDQFFSPTGSIFREQRTLACLLHVRAFNHIQFVRFVKTTRLIFQLLLTIIITTKQRHNTTYLKVVVILCKRL